MEVLDAMNWTRGEGARPGAYFCAKTGLFRDGPDQGHGTFTAKLTRPFRFARSAQHRRRMPPGQLRGSDLGRLSSPVHCLREHLLGVQFELQRFDHTDLEVWICEHLVAGDDSNGAHWEFEVSERTNERAESEAATTER